MAHQLIDLTRDMLDTELTALSAESYQRAYPIMIQVSDINLKEVHSECIHNHFRFSVNSNLRKITSKNREKQLKTGVQFITPKTVFTCHFLQFLEFWKLNRLLIHFECTSFGLSKSKLKTHLLGFFWGVYVDSLNHQKHNWWWSIKLLFKKKNLVLS